MLQNKTLINPVLRFTIELLNIYHFWVIALFGCILILGACGPLNVLLISTITNKLLTNSSDTILRHIFWPSFFLLLNALLYDVALQTWHILNNKIQYEIRGRVTLLACKFTLQQKNGSYQEINASKIMQNINLLLTNIRMLTDRISMNFFSNAFRLIIAISIMCVINFMFFVTMSLFIILYGIATYAYYKKIDSLSMRNLPTEEDVTAQIKAGIENSEIIKNYQENSEEIFSLFSMLKEVQKANIRKINFTVKWNFVKNSCFVIAFAAVLYTLIYLKTFDKISIRNFIMILGLCINIGNAIWVITEQFVNFNETVSKCKLYMTKLFIPNAVENESLNSLISRMYSNCSANINIDNLDIYEVAQPAQNDCQNVA